MLPYLSAAAFASMASIRVADPMLPALGRDFNSLPADAAGAITSFTLAYGLMQLVWGPLGDRLGKLRLINWATLAATVGSLLCALSPTLPMLTLARLLTGACCAAIIPMAIAYLGDTVEYSMRQAALARFATGTLTGMIAGQVIGGLAADTLGWRAAFGLLCVLFLITGIAVLRLRRRLDVASPPQPVSPMKLSTIIAGYEGVLRSGWSRWILMAGLLEGAVMFGPMAFTPTWLHEDANVTLTVAGSIVASMGLGGLLYTSRARQLIARLGESRLIGIGSVVIALSLCALSACVQLLPASAIVPAAIGCCVTLGFGFYMLHNTLQVMASQMSAQSRATAVGLFAVSIFFGQASGVAIAARITPIMGQGRLIIVSGILMALLGSILAWRVSWKSQ